MASYCNKKYLGTADSAIPDVIQATRLSVVRATYNDDQPGLFFMLGTGNIDRDVLVRPIVKSIDSRALFFNIANIKESSAKTTDTHIYKIIFQSSNAKRLQKYINKI